MFKKHSLIYIIVLNMYNNLKFIIVIITIFSKRFNIYKLSVF